MRLDHERLHVYKTALALVTTADHIADAIPRGHASLADQLRRAAVSVCLNIAEGAGEYSPKEKARFYRMARRSAIECAAVLDIAMALGLREGGSLDACVVRARGLVRSIVSILVRLCQRNQEEQGGGEGQGRGEHQRPRSGGGRGDGPRRGEGQGQGQGQGQGVR